MFKGEPMTQVKLVFYLPLRDNDGRTLYAEIADAEQELFNRFAGWTMVGVVKGMYMMADKTPAFDEGNAYELVTEDTRVSEVETILLAFKARTTQEAIYFEIIRNTEVRFL
jgi:hypothetical protein